MDIKLGLKINKKPFLKIESLPLYIIGNYDITQADINGFTCILMAPIQGLPTSATLLKHMKIVEELSSLPVALELGKITSFRRNSLIENDIPFIADRQIYLPFMGAFLSAQAEKCPVNDKMSVAAQVALIKWFMDPVEEFRISVLMKGLGYTPMTASRVARQFEAMRLFDIHKDGATSVLTAKNNAEQTFNKAQKYMFSPVSASGYMDVFTKPDLVVAGMDAVSERTMLNMGNIRTFATFGINRSELRQELVDEKLQVYVELWKYDPRLLLWKDGMADPVSVSLSLSDTDDERVEGAVKDMLSDFWKR